MFRVLTVFLCFCSLSFGMSKESSIKRCTANIQLLKTIQRKFVLDDLNSFFGKLVARLEEIAERLKSAKDAKAIVELRKSCDNGFDAARFLLETFENQEIKPDQSDDKKIEENQKQKDVKKERETKKDDAHSTKTSPDTNSHKS